MIARISNPGSFLAGAVKYNTDKVDFGGGTLLACKNFSTHLGTDLDAASAEKLMLQQLSLNSRVEKGVFSCSLNPNIEDLSSLKDLCEKNGCADKDELYTKMADLYMKGMGYGDQPYIVFRHNDIDREHIHIVSIRVDDEGNRISNFNEHLRSERVRGEVNESLGLSTKGEIPTKDLTFEQKRELAEHRFEFIENIKFRIGDSNTTSQTIASFGDPDMKDLLLKQSQSNLFHSISNALKYVSENYSPKDLKEYNKILAQFNLVCKVSDSENGAGKRICGCQYAVLGSDGEVCSHLIKGSKFGKEYSLPGLEKRFALASSQESLLESASCSRDFIKSSIDTALKAPVKIDLGFIADRLKANGISLNVVMSLDDPTKIKGINFVDNVHGHTFNGSELGKAYSFASINRSIESHNKAIDSAMREASFVPKDVFKEAFRSLNSEFNRIRKEDYQLESSAIRSIACRKDDFVALLQDKHLLSPVQAEKVFDSFNQFKVKDLPQIDFKEASYQQKLITSAVQFSLLIPDENARMDFLHRSGVDVSRSYGSLVFSSFVKSDVSLSFKDICERTASSPLKVSALPFNPFRIPEPSDSLSPLSKAERQFVSAFVSQDGKPVKGDFSAVASLLSKDDQSLAVGSVFLSKNELSSAFKQLNASFRGLMRDGSYSYQSDLISSLDSHRDLFVSASMKSGLNSFQGERMFSIFKESKLSDLPAVVEKESAAAERRIASAVIFADSIASPSDRSEFLLRMGVTPVFRSGELVFQRSDKPQYSFTFRELACRDERLASASPTFASAVPEPTHAGLAPFSKKERDFVSSYINDSVIKDKVDSRFSEPASYLPSSEQNRIARLGNSSRVADILDRFQDASILSTVKALWSRGYVLKPFASENGVTVFKAGMHWGSNDSFIALPPDIQKRLRDTDYMATYQKIDKLVLDGKWNSPKMQTLKLISRASDFNDAGLLFDTINKVAKSNRPLADAMSKAVGDRKRPDYARVSELVFYYTGEKTIVLPPPSSKVDSLSNHDAEVARLRYNQDPASVHVPVVPSKVGYQQMLDAIRSGNSLQLIMNMSTGNENQESVRNSNSHKF